MTGLYHTFFHLSKNPSEVSLLEELWSYLVEKYFTIDISQYHNLNLEIGGNGVINLSWAIVGLCLGMVLASFLAVYEKRGLGEFIRKLLDQECYSPQTAKTLYELGYRKNSAVRSSLRSGSLSKVVICTQKAEYDAQIAQKREEYEAFATKDSPKFKSLSYKINFEKDTFYIPKDASYAAEMRYDKKGSGIAAVLISIGIAVLLAAFIIFILPDMLQLLDNFVGVLSPEANYH